MGLIMGKHDVIQKNWKYITYYNATGGGPSHGHRQHAQISLQTDKLTDTQTRSSLYPAPLLEQINNTMLLFVTSHIIWNAFIESNNIGKQKQHYNTQWNGCMG